jgi:hypothetical protein
MPADPFVTQAVAQAGLTAFETAANAGTAAIVRGYEGAVPADADTALSGNDTLFTITCAASIFTSKTDGAPGAVGTFDATTPDASADATDTLTFFRILTQDAGTVVFQGTAATSDADMTANTTAITTGSEVNLESGTVTYPESNAG